MDTRPSSRRLTPTEVKGANDGVLGIIAKGANFQNR